jgi:hypothetical protein
MSLIGILILIVILWAIRAYVPNLPVPVPIILTILIVILAIVFAVVLLQVLGLLPPLLHEPVRVR